MMNHWTRTSFGISTFTWHCSNKLFYWWTWINMRTSIYLWIYYAINTYLYSVHLYKPTTFLYLGIAKCAVLKLWVAVSICFVCRTNETNWKAQFILVYFTDLAQMVAFYQKAEMKRNKNYTRASLLFTGRKYNTPLQGDGQGHYWVGDIGTAAVSNKINADICRFFSKILTIFLVPYGPVADAFYVFAPLGFFIRFIKWNTIEQDCKGRNSGRIVVGTRGQRSVTHIYLTCFGNLIFV